MDPTRWPELLLARGGDLQVALFFGVLAILIVIERVWPRRPGRLGRRERWPANFGLTALNVLALGFVPFTFIGAALWAQSSGVGLLNLARFPDWLVVVATLLVRGLISTGTHWLFHRVPWLWRIHRVHHLDTEIDVSSTVRFHPLELLVSPFVGAPVVVLFGLSPWVLALYEILDVLVTLFSHANLRMPAAVDRWLRYVIVTPDLHRVHHSSYQPETDSNFGAVFPIWDLVLGTYRASPRAPHEEMELGLSELRGPEAHHLGHLLGSPLWPRLGERRATVSPSAAR